MNFDPGIIAMCLGALMIGVGWFWHTDQITLVDPNLARIAKLELQVAALEINKLDLKSAGVKEVNERIDMSQKRMHEIEIESAKSFEQMAVIRKILFAPQHITATIEPGKFPMKMELVKRKVKL
jgi:hypothetical protein